MRRLSAGGGTRNIKIDPVFWAENLKRQVSQIPRRITLDRIFQYVADLFFH